MTVRNDAWLWRLVGLWGGVLLTCVWLSAADANAPKEVPSFFNSTEVKSSNLKPFKKWTGAVERYTKEKEKAKTLKGHCISERFNCVHYEQWIKFLLSIKDKDKLTQIKAVNAYMNKSKYITDPVNWGKKDFWATPGEFMAKFGDCEDYAIAKFMSLRLLGFCDDDMRVVAVKDMNLKVGHAILIVFFEGVALVLDNQIKQVVAADRVRHYQPVFSINTKFWWRHRS